MKKKLLLINTLCLKIVITAIILQSFINQQIYAGATLKSADLVVVCYNSDYNDDFAFVALNNLPGNSVIFITDEGWDDVGFTFDGGEDVFKWTIPASGITAGTIIRFTNKTGTSLELYNSSQGTVVHVNGTDDMELHRVGDQLIIFQTNNDVYNGTIQRLNNSDNVELGPIYAFNGDGGEPQTYGWLDQGIAHANASSQAPEYAAKVLTSGGSGIAFGLLTQSDLKNAVAGEYDNYRYDGPTTSATKEEWITRIHTTSNWLADDADTLSVFEGALASDFYMTLPVELTSFSASVVENEVILNWETATEVNNYGFEVERQLSVNSNQSSEWETIGFVEGHGNSNSPKYYEFVDETAPADNLEYRLKQIDTDGNYEYYSLTAKVDNNVTDVEDNSLPLEFALEQNYPNPFNPSTAISYQLSAVSKVQLKVFDLLGKEVATLVNKEQAAGNYSINFDASGLPSGMYVYRITAGEFTQSRKMLLLR